MTNDHLLTALNDVRRGDDDNYSAGIKFGYALGVIQNCPIPQYLRLLDLLHNAAQNAAIEKFQRRTAA